MAATKLSGSDPSPQPGDHILIIGAGITGLTLAQALRKRNSENPSAAPIHFSIYERDEHALARGAGWALSLHWALGQFTALLPQELVQRLPEALVDPDSAARGELGNFRLFNLQTGKDDFMTPPSDSPRNRFSREKLRRLLMDGLDIHWSKNLETIDYPKQGEVVAQFSDGTSATGTILVGCDGSRSQVRRVLCPANYENNVVPIRLLGVTAPYSPERCKPIQALDRYFFQCCDPATDTFMFYGFLNVPTLKEQDATTETLPITCQVLTSWPCRPGFMGKDEVTEVPVENNDRLMLMKSISAGWVEPFKQLVHDIPDTAEVKVVNLEDWPPQKGAWNNREGRVTLIGDAAHAMTMYRGEAANHGIADVRVFLEQFVPGEGEALKSKIDAYEVEMIERTRPAVLRSRKACLHAHDYASVTDQSPLIARRAIVADDED
ncbi:hypothetical protein BP6252_05762 [Coleophoma cylindrospora]|uniref:FAD-binding domain-containing protein n=1 Tax=Coleophoma cylindrospora TaxID=1849047 RepID=A0A3D8RUF5_9HELO|nr:hypothetical protein BP6252_05762 [Coleophoma cylindrospora]